MPNGPAQMEGKRIVRRLIKMGYEPSRGELSTMSQSDTDYDYMYSYVKNGPPPLKDLCVRKIRESLRKNVIHACEKWSLDERERLQVSRLLSII